MSRDDSVLNTGVTSASLRISKDKENKKAEKAAVRDRVSPAAEIVKAQVEKERTRVMEELAGLPLGMDAKEERVLARLEAIQMHLRFLTDFNNSMANLLRVPEQKAVEEDE